MKYDWDPEKNEWLKKERKISEKYLLRKLFFTYPRDMYGELPIIRTK